MNITHRGTVGHRDDNLRGCEPSRDEMSGVAVSFVQMICIVIEA
ncbi:hypothetical protein [Cohnella cholangitidis]|nr:hypothetical protein [Cohnella cholangitidis]